VVSALREGEGVTLIAQIAPILDEDAPSVAATAHKNAPVRFHQAVDLYIADQRAKGRINSPNTEREYRGTLCKHAEDVGNRDPAYTNREDVKRTLGRWHHPNTRSKNRAILV
jgi:hypothetical protein